MLLAPRHPVPIFPLPGLVLFPHAVIPLHVFELRYRTMVREALSGERLVALALLKPGWEDEYHSNPEFFPVGCLARFEEVEWLPNDCYDLKVQGVSRVRFRRPVREYPYRAARVDLIPQAPYAEDDPLVQLDKRALLQTLERCRDSGPKPAGSMLHGLGDQVGYEPLVNWTCTLVEAPALEKLELLEIDSVIERGRRIRDRIERGFRRPARPPGAGERN